MIPGDFASELGNNEESSAGGAAPPNDLRSNEGTESCRAMAVGASRSTLSTTEGPWDSVMELLCAVEDSASGLGEALNLFPSAVTEAT